MRKTKNLIIYFYTTSIEKYFHAKLVFERNGLELKYFVSKTDEYQENHHLSTKTNLTNALLEIKERIGSNSYFFVEDTSIRIEALSSKDKDFPGQKVKEWFGNTDFESLDQQLKSKGNNRQAIVKSDIALNVPGLADPVFFSGASKGHVAEIPPIYKPSRRYPWLTPYTFNGWFIPRGKKKTLGEMTVEESWGFDFRTDSLEKLIMRIKEYNSVLNSPPHNYRLLKTPFRTKQLSLFNEKHTQLIVLGYSFTGKTTLSEVVAKTNDIYFLEASIIAKELMDKLCIDAEYSNKKTEKLYETYGKKIIGEGIIQKYYHLMQKGFVISGLRTVEEVEVIRDFFPMTKIIYINSPERARLRRSLLRGRPGDPLTIDQLKKHDKEHDSFGVTKSASKISDIRLRNDGSLDSFVSKAEDI